MKSALSLCKDKKPIVVVDHAPWYGCAFEWLHLDWFTMTFGARNYIERWYRTFKERTKRFYNNFPIRNEDKAIERISKFLHLFAYWYNHIRHHETLKTTPFSLS